MLGCGHRSAHSIHRTGSTCHAGSSPSSASCPFQCMRAPCLPSPVGGPVRSLLQCSGLKGSLFGDIKTHYLHGQPNKDCYRRILVVPHTSVRFWLEQRALLCCAAGMHPFRSFWGGGPACRGSGGTSNCLFWGFQAPSWVWAERRGMRRRGGHVIGSPCARALDRDGAVQWKCSSAGARHNLCVSRHF